MTETELVTRKDVDGVAYLKLNRPDKLNALTVGMFEQLRKHITQLGKDDAIACVVLAGAGKCFSAGHDLADIAGGERVPSRGWHSETLRMMELLPKPVIAAVHGHCYTGALEVALAADFIVAAESAKFADTHAKWALTPVWGMSQRLPRRVGRSTAKRMMFTAATLTAGEAVSIGLAECVFPDESFEADVESMCRGIVANSAFSHQANKKLLETTDGKALDAGLQWEVFASEGHGPDMDERISGFMKR
ncbi:MAG: enoyl-CoA hydratase/carnithine racemase [Candidatus Azotimanducaceae bacterium]|jgi:enoyl-CoA hydratase